MKDERLLTPETFCDIAEAVEHAEALLRLILKIGKQPYSEVDCFGLAASDLEYQLKDCLPWMRDMIADDIKASKELP